MLIIYSTDDVQMNAEGMGHGIQNRESDTYIYRQYRRNLLMCNYMNVHPVNFESLNA